QSEPPQEFSTATLHAIPFIILVFFLNTPLSANLKNSIIFTSSFLSPGRSDLDTCASGVSFQSTRVLTNAEFSRGNEAESAELGNGKSFKGSQTSRENGSKTL
ncbi:hypothetical protein A2U01_0042898, partial [Trifolium medium]|nr:hypothetical protein [Trifolium medium]